MVEISGGRKWVVPGYLVVVDARLSGNKRGKSEVTVPFLTASLMGKLFSDMVRVVDCHAGVLGSNPGDPKDFPLGITSRQNRLYCL